MAGLTITEGTKEHFDEFKNKKKCSSATAIEILLMDHELFAAMQRENALLRRENERLTVGIR